MTRRVKAEREALQVRKNNGLITQFVLFAILRAIDLGSLIAVLENAWRQTGDWADLDARFVNATRNASATVVGERRIGGAHRECRETSSWERADIDRAIQNYNIILWVTVFLNIISIAVYITHFSFWVATIRMAFKEVEEHDDRITRLTRSSHLSLMTAVIRDMPLSCLNTELLVLRSGRAGLACIGCSLSAGCSPQSDVVKTLDSAKRLLYISYSTMLVNSLWKGVSGFYRLSRIEGFQIHIIRACAAIMFAFLYSATTFTPAMLVLIYRYLPMPGHHSPFVHQLAMRVVVVGGVIWIIGGSALLCCPILNAIKLTAD